MQIRTRCHLILKLFNLAQEEKYGNVWSQQPKTLKEEARSQVSFNSHYSQTVECVSKVINCIWG